MECKKLRTKEDLLIPLLSVTVLLIAAAAGFGFYYDLNDDVLMKDILAGVYTGVPEARNMQMLYPLTMVLAALYRILPGAPILGIFLFAVQALALLCIERCVVGLFRKSLAKWIAGGAFIVFAVGFMMYHLVYVQYSVTCGMLMGAAILWLLTRRKQWPMLILTAIAVCIRSEMALLLLPYLCLAGLWRWMKEEHFRDKRNVIFYLSLFGTVVLIFLLSVGADSLAYGSGDWKAFRAFFDARTGVYDFHSAAIRDYEGNEAFYDGLGLEPEEVQLLANYNFGLDDGIDESVLEQVDHYGDITEGSFRHSLKEGLWLYVQRLRNNRSLGMDEMPYLLAEGLLGILILLACVRHRQFLPVFWTAVLFGGRSLLWMYLILNERVPDRIAHPMYLCEILMLGWLLWELLKDEKRSPLSLGTFSLGLIAVCLLISLPGSLNRTGEEKLHRDDINRIDQLAREYYEAHPENLYLADVMSTVEYSQGLFEADNEFGNYDLLGGWMNKSPLTGKKLERFGQTSMEEAVLTCEQIRLVGEPGAFDDWLPRYLEYKNVSLTLRLEETLEAGDRSLEVWKLSKE